MIVVDASAALSGLIHDGPARKALLSERLHAPHLVDYEVASVLRRTVVAGQLTVGNGWAALDGMRRLGMLRHSTLPLLDRIWELRDTCSAYDASYVALAEALDCALLTADARLSGAPGLRCAVTLVPR